MGYKKKEYELLIRIGAQVDKSIDKTIGSVTKKFKAFAALKIAKDVITTVGRAAIDVTKESLDAYSELETHVASASNVFISDLKSSGKTLADGRDQIEEFTKTLSTKIPYSASEAADALYYLGLTGLDLGSSMDVVDQMMKLSYVDGEDVATTVDLITDAMSNLHMQINRENTTAFMDELTTVMSATNTNAQQALETILNVGSTAQMLGTSRQSLEAMTGILANYGTKGSESGTALNSMLTRMIGNKEALKAYSSLGISMYDRNGNFKGVETVLKETGEVLDKMTEQKKNPIMKKLFGTHYMNEGNILLNSLKETTDELGNSTSEYQQVLEEIMDSGGTLEEMYQNMEDTYAAQKKIMDNSIENVKSTLGESVSGAARESMKGFNQEISPYMQQAAQETGNFIDTYITPNIGSWIHEGANFFKGIKDGADEFSQDPKFQQIVTNVGGIKDNMVDAFSNLDLSNITQATNDLKDTALEVVGDITGALNKITEAAPGALQAATDTAAGAGSLVNAGIQGVRSIPKWISNVDGAIRKNSGRGGAKFFADVFDAKEGSLLDKMAGLSGSDILSGLKSQLNNFDKVLGFSDAKEATIQATKEREQAIQESLTPTLINIQDNGGNAGDSLSTVYSAGNRAAEVLSRIGNIALPPTSTSNTRRATPTEAKRYKNKGALPFADGGIVTRPTLSLIGEAGEKEAVIPLSKIGDVARNVSGGSVNYAPVINVTGGGDAEGVKAALSQSYQEFKANYSRMVKENRRLAFTS